MITKRSHIKYFFGDYYILMDFIPSLLNLYENKSLHEEDYIFDESQQLNFGSIHSSII
jgi:hypothetical protein